VLVVGGGVIAAGADCGVGAGDDGGEGCEGGGGEALRDCRVGEVALGPSGGAAGTDTTGATRAALGAIERAPTRCAGPGIAGARTTLRLGAGPGPSATPAGVGDEASRRGMRAPPTTAIASRRAATARSFWLM
jgi:hypothetical protein